MQALERWVRCASHVHGQRQAFVEESAGLWVTGSPIGLAKEDEDQRLTSSMLSVCWIHPTWRRGGEVSISLIPRTDPSAWHRAAWERRREKQRRVQQRDVSSQRSIEGHAVGRVLEWHATLAAVATHLHSVGCAHLSRHRCRAVLGDELLGRSGVSMIACCAKAHRVATARTLLVTRPEEAAKDLRMPCSVSSPTSWSNNALHSRKHAESQGRTHRWASIRCQGWGAALQRTGSVEKSGWLGKARRGATIMSMWVRETAS